MLLMSREGISETVWGRQGGKLLGSRLVVSKDTENISQQGAH